jgi:uncharacterized protein YlxW (UPF0749 family)
MPVPETEAMSDKNWVGQLSLAVLSLVLGLLLVVQLRSQRDIRQAAGNTEWELVVADLIDSNARLRDEIEVLQLQLVGLQDLDRGGAVLESLVDEVNHLRVANGLAKVSGPGIELEIVGSVSVLDLHDLINELRNAGAEALALNGRRIVASSAIGTDGEQVTVDGVPVPAPYHLEAIGEAHTLEVALTRPGGLVELLRQAPSGILITVSQKDKVTLPVYDQPMPFVYAEPAE